MLKVAGRIFLLFMILGVVGSLPAADVWVTKDYKQWNAKDVAEILGDSPWARPVLVHRTWSSGGELGPSNRQENVPTEHSVMYSTPPSNGPSGAVAADNAQTGAGNVTFMVRWVSAATIRRADARNFVLAQHGDPAAAEDYANEKSDTYDVTVAGSDMTPFGSLDKPEAIEQLRQKTFLENRQAKLHVEALKVDVRMAPDSKTVVAVTFHFPKTNANGSPLLATGLKGVDFRCRAGKTDVDTHFDLTKMMTQQGLDL